MERRNQVDVLVIGSSDLVVVECRLDTPVRDRFRRDSDEGSRVGDDGSYPGGQERAQGVRMPAMKLAVLLVALVACRSGEKKAKEEPAAAAASGAFHSLERGASQGFRKGQLAVGGGFVYWVNQPRIDKNGLGKSVIERKPGGGGAVEPVTEPGDIYSIAADGESLYWSDKRAVWARPHGGGEPVKLTGGTMWLEVVPGQSHLFLRSTTRMALVAKTGGGEEPVWEGRRSKHHVSAAGDVFYAAEELDRSRERKGKLSAFEPGKPPRVLVEDGPVSGAVGASGDHVYFSGGGTDVAAPLWRVPVAGGVPEQVGHPDWGFGEFVIAKGAVYGMIFTGTWKLQKLPLAGGAPRVLDDLSGFSAMVTSLAADDTHLYYLTDWDVKRVPL
jgi:hypothetical protein